jgi:hypothetical protein
MMTWSGQGGEARMSDQFEVFGYDDEMDDEAQRKNRYLASTTEAK